MTSNYLDICERAARAGGSVLQQHDGRCQAREKAPATLATDADLTSQATIRQILSGCLLPPTGLFGEEDEAVTIPRDRPPRYCWVVDPLDGTTKFSHGVERYAVSIALLDGDQAVVGVVFDPVRDHMFSASCAFLNDHRMAVSGVEHLTESLVAASIPARLLPDTPGELDFRQVSAVCQATRRTGSAALDLCDLACEHFDACWASATKLWDVAAGMLLVQEAGGVFTGWEGKPFDTNNGKYVAAARDSLHRQLVARLGRVTE